MTKDDLSFFSMLRKPLCTLLKGIGLVKKGKVTSIVDAFSALDKAAKKKVIHKKKASRLKALVSKLTRSPAKKK